MNKLNTVLCPVCKSSRTFFEMNRHQATTPQYSKILLKSYFDRLGIDFPNGMTLFDREIYACADCQVFFVNPMYGEDELRVLYSDYVLPAERTAPEETREAFAHANQDAITARAHMIINFGLEGQKGMRVLDVGSYKGLNHAAFERFGFDTSGIELSPSAARFCAEYVASPDKVIVGEFGKYEFKEKYGLVTMHHVIEHVIDLDEFVGRARAILEDDGYLIIETPLYEFFSTGNRNGRFIDIYHTLYFSSSSLVLLLSNHGFSLEKMYPIYFSLEESDSHIYGCYLFQKRASADLAENYRRLAAILEEEMIEKANRLIHLQNANKFRVVDFSKKWIRAKMNRLIDRRRST